MEQGELISTRFKWERISHSAWPMCRTVCRYTFCHPDSDRIASLRRRSAVQLERYPASIYGRKDELGAPVGPPAMTMADCTYFIPKDKKQLCKTSRPCEEGSIEHLLCKRCSPGARMQPVELLSQFRKMAQGRAFAATGNQCLGRAVTVQVEGFTFTKVLVPSDVAEAYRLSKSAERSNTYQLLLRVGMQGESC